MRGHRRRRATQRWPATPTRPEGCGGTAGISSLLLLADGVASTRRRASICPPSRSQQLASYFLDRTLALVIWLFIGGLVFAQERAPGGRAEGQDRSSQFRVDVNLVTVRFSVKNRAGQFVTGLAENEISIFEGGVRQELAFFQPPARREAAPPVTLVFLLDVSGSTFGSRTEEIVAADNFLKNVPAGTEAAVYGFSEKLQRFQDFTTNLGQVRKGFERARRVMGRTSLYASMADVLEILGRRNDGRRHVVVVISDGEDPDTERADSVIRLALQHEVTVFTIWVPSARTVLVSEADASIKEAGDRQHAVYATLSNRTGGRSFESFDSIIDFEGTLAEINAELFGSLYSAGYYTANPYTARELRKIEVSASNANYQVQGVFASLPERLRAKREFVSALFNNTGLAALPKNWHAQFREIGAELDVLPMKPNAELEGFPFRIQVSPFSLAGFEQPLRTHLGILGVLVDSRGEEISRIRDFLEVNLSRADIARGRSIVYNSKVVAPPGQYALWLAVLDLSTWRMTAFENEVLVRSSR